MRSGTRDRDRRRFRGSWPRLAPRSLPSCWLTTKTPSPPRRTRTPPTARRWPPDAIGPVPRHTGRVDVVQKLRRWQAAGGFVDIAEQSDGAYRVTLTSCDDVVMEQFAASGLELQGFVSEIGRPRP